MAHSTIVVLTTKKMLWVVFYMLLSGYPALGSAEGEPIVDGAQCFHHLTTLHRISQNPKAKIATREHLSFGKKATPGDLKDLREGRYVYLLERSGELVWSNAVPSHDVEVEGTAPVVVSHRSLTAFQTASTGIPPDVVAAGEFLIVEIAGKSYVQEVNNRSFTFLGGEVNLAAADKALIHFGLPSDDKTMRIDYSVSGPDVDRHADSAEKAVLEIRYHHSPEMAQLRRLMTRFQHQFPRANTHGHIDIPLMEKALAVALSKTELQTPRDPRKILLVTHANTYFPYMERQGLPAMMEYLDYKQIKIAEIESALNDASFFIP